MVAARRSAGAAAIVVGVVAILGGLLDVTSASTAAPSPQNPAEENPVFTGSWADNLELYGLRPFGVPSYFPLDPNAEGYVVLLPEGSSLTSLQGSATIAGQQSTSTPGGAVSAAGAAVGAAAAGTLVESVSEGADVGGTGAGGPLSAECPTEWIQLETSVATLYYFSPDGTADEGPSWRQENPSIWIRCLANGDIAVWLGQPGTSPPAL